MIKTILCTGDSHTWGQGAAGLMESFSPPAQAGELRQSSFVFKSYVNELRRMVNARTASDAGDWSPYMTIENSPVILEKPAGLIRLQFACKAEKSTVTVTADTGERRTLDLTDGAPNTYRFLVFFFEDEKIHRLEILSETGNAQFCRAEWHRGPFAVINSGIGSCPVSRYMETYWADYVEALHPSLIIMEAHTINDWLLGEGPQVYQKRLEQMIGRAKATGSQVLLLTVSPILGVQFAAGSDEPYEAYVEASRRAAENGSVLLCDANAQMNLQLKGLTEEAAAACLFADPWHVNDRGHQIYAEMIYNALLQGKYI